jgi:zinc transport system substrate-binding protein
MPTSSHPIRAPRIILLGFVLALLGACAKPADTGPRLVLVEVAPLVGLVEPLLGTDIEIRAIVPAGVSPHGYQLTPSDIVDLSRASLVITVGAPLEPAINRAIDQHADPARVFSIAATLGIDAAACDHPAHDHASHDGHDHAHSHNHGADPHLWLDPQLMIRFVEAIDADLTKRQLVGKDHGGYMKHLTAAITSIDASFSNELAPFEGRAIITHHDAFRRIADRYGLVVAEVIRPVSAVEPTPGDMARATEAIREYNAGAIFVEPQFPDALPRRIAQQLNVKLYTLDPVGSEDWVNLMRANLRALVAGLSESGRAPDPGAQPHIEPEG